MLRIPQHLRYLGFGGLGFFLEGSSLSITVSTHHLKQTRSKF